MKHYIIYSTNNEVRFDLATGISFLDAMSNYMQNMGFADIEDGQVLLEGASGQVVKCEHILEAIERCLKVHLPDTTIREVSADNWDSPLALVFSGRRKGDDRKSIRKCRERFGHSLRLPPRAFVWHLTIGTLVSFYRVVDFVGVIENRFLLSGGKKSIIQEWHGGYDEIVQNLIV